MLCVRQFLWYGSSNCILEWLHMYECLYFPSFDPDQLLEIITD